MGTCSGTWTARIDSNFFIDEILEILKIAIIGEIDFIFEHTLHSIEEFFVHIFISGIIFYQAIENILDSFFIFF